MRRPEFVKLLQERFRVSIPRGIKRHQHVFSARGKLFKVLVREHFHVFFRASFVLVHVWILVDVDASFSLPFILVRVVRIFVANRRRVGKTNRSGDIHEEYTKGCRKKGRRRE